MTEFLLKRSLSMLVTLFVASLFIFSLVRLVPGDPVMAAIGEENYTPELYAAMERRLGLDRPLHEQLLTYLERLATLDLGTSFRNDSPVLQNIAEQFPYSFYLTIQSLLIAITLGLSAGMVSAVFHNTILDQATMITALVGLCIPNFLLGLVLILFFSGQLEWFPSFGVGSLGNLASLAYYDFLPALALGASAAGLQARLIRSSLLEVLSQDYIRTARSKGLGQRVVLFKHTLKNALTPIVTLVGLDVARLLTGTVIVETLFSRRGVGKLLVDAIYFRDYPQIQGTLLVFIFIVILVNAVTDLAYGMIDPRVRVG